MGVCEDLSRFFDTGGHAWTLQNSERQSQGVLIRIVVEWYKHNGKNHTYRYNYILSVFLHLLAVAERSHGYADERHRQRSNNYECAHESDYIAEYI